MKKIKVSVIVPVYNVESYVEYCLDSLINQTLKDIEIVIVNDGSTDNSEKLVKKYCEKDNRIKYYYKENGGLSSARNYGLTKATGEYILFVDSDDFIDCDMLEKMYEKANSTKSEVVICPVTYIYDTKVVKDKIKDESVFGYNIKKKPEMLKHINCVAWNKLIKKDLFDKTKILFPEGIWFEDLPTMYPLMLEANKISLVNIPFYNYRCQRQGAITSLVDPRNAHMLIGCKKALDYYRKKTKNKEILLQMEKKCISYISSRYHIFIKSKNYKVSKEYINAVSKFFRDNIENWKDKVDDVWMQKRVRLFMKNPILFKIYLLFPTMFLKLISKMIKLLKKLKNKLVRKVKKPIKISQEEKDLEKIRNVQEHGLKMIEKTQKLLSKEGIVCFADFGTLLGIIRENKLLGHDKDVDLGVIGVEEYQISQIRTLLERNGYKMWREFYLNDKIVEQCWHINGIKIDLNFYRKDKKGQRTWLFYIKPNTKYKYGDYSAITMCYSGIEKFKKVKVQKKFDINIPEDPEKLLEQKYGKDWKVPNTGWIYWKNPKAEIVEEMGHFRVYQYK